MEYEALREEYEHREYEIEFLGEAGTPMEGNERFEELKRMLLEKMNEVHQMFSTYGSDWRTHTKTMHPYTKIASVFKKSNVQTSQAFCKFLEILSRFPGLITDEVKNKRILRSFHICEGPGNFIAALDRYLCANFPTIEWEWRANTLNPYYENSGSVDKLLDDSFIVNQVDNWQFGPDNSGDITKISSNYWLELKQIGYFDLVTADGSIYVQNTPGDQENLVLDLLNSEIRIAVELLAENGSFVLKMFTMHEEKTRDLIRNLVVRFEKCTVFKPICSKAGNSERYLICTGYSKNRVRRVSEQEIYDIEEMFTNRQISAISRNLDCFQREETNKMRKAKNRLVDSLLDRMDFQRICQTIRESHIRPDFSFHSRPWSQLFDVNLVERISVVNTVEKAKEVVKMYLEKNHPNFENLSITSSAPVNLVFGEDSWDLIYTTESIVMNHSMFLDPMLLNALHIIDRNVCIDIFANCSKFGTFSRILKIPEDFIIDCSEITNFGELKCLIETLIENNTQRVSLTFSNSGISLILSRLSASIITLFIGLFRNFEYENQGLSFSEQKLENVSEIRSLLNLLSIKAESTQKNLRNFVKLSVHAETFLTIFDFNSRNILRAFNFN